MALDLAKFTFTAEQIRSINELVFDEIINAPELQMLHTVFPGIVYDKEIGFIGEGGLVGVARQNCNPTAQDWKIETRKLKWEPKSWEIRLEECFADLESTASVYALNTGVDIADLTTTDYMVIVSMVLATAIKKFIIRLFWFNDEDAENFSDGGYITNGIDVKYFNILNGFWKQFEILLTARPGQRVTIAENAAATYALQRLDPDNVLGYLEKLVFEAPLILQGREGGIIPCTKSFYNGYALALKGKDLESTYSNLVNGQKTLTYDGIPLIPMPIWDEMIGQFQNTGTKLINPHRAIYTTKEFLAVGVDSEDSFEKVEVFPDKKSRLVITDVMGKADAKFLRDDMIQIAI